jgi:predicted transcriptional regulator
MERQELLRIRKAMHVTQEQMANLLRLPVETIRKLEAGTLDAPLSKKIVRTLIARDFWLGEEEDKAKGGG